MTKSRQVQIGDVALVPLDSGAHVPARIMYIVKNFEDVILLETYGVVVSSGAMPDDLRSMPSSRRYTYDDPIREGRWPVVGNIPLTDAEEDVSLRRIGGNVYLKETLLRKATQEDKSIPKMNMCPESWIIEDAKKLIGEAS